MTTKTTFPILSESEISKNFGLLGVSVQPGEISAFETRRTQELWLVLLNTALESEISFGSEIAAGERVAQLETLFSVCDEGIGIWPSRKLIGNPASDTEEAIAVYSGLMNFIGYKLGTLAEKRKLLADQISDLNRKVSACKDELPKTGEILKSEKTKFANSGAHEKMRKLEKEISDLVQSVAVSRSEGENLEKKESEISAKIKTLESEIGKLESEISNENSLVSDFESYRGLIDELNTMQKKAENYQREISDHSAQTAALTGTRGLVEEATAVILRASEMIGKIDSLNQHIVEQNRLIQIGNSKTKKFQDDLEICKSTQASLQQKISDLGKTLEIAAGARSEMQRNISKANSRLDQQLAAERENDRKFRDFQNRGRQQIATLNEEIGNFEQKISSVPDILKEMENSHKQTLKISDQKFRNLADKIHSRY